MSGFDLIHTYSIDALAHGICMYVCMCVYMILYVYVCICVCVCICGYVYVCIYARVCVYMCMCAYVSVLLLLLYFHLDLRVLVYNLYQLKNISVRQAHTLAFNPLCS